MISFWEQQSFTNYQYAVIGGGLVGLSTAISIKEMNPRASVVVFERGILPRGASTRNAGFACFGSLSELLSDIDTMGEVKARQLVEDRWSGLMLLKDRLGERRLKYRNYGGYELLFQKDMHYLERLQYVNQWLEPVFDQQVFHLRNRAIKDFGFSSTSVAALLWNPLEGQLHPGAMMKSLIALAKEKGIDYLTGTQVEHLDPEGGSVSLLVTSVNADEVRFRCSRAAVCTNAFTNSLLPNLDIKPGRGTVLVTRPVEGLKFKGVFHYDQGYYYFRNTGTRVIFGGGRNLDLQGEETTEFGFNEPIVAHLRKDLAEIILPGKDFEIEQQWSGIMAFGADKQPLVGLYCPEIGYAVRLGGMGVALGSLVGQRLANLICFSEND